MAQDESFDIEESSRFRANLVAPSHKALMSGLASTKGGLIWVMVEDLLVLEGFNPRTPSDKLKAHIRALADSIKENGFFEHKPISCMGALRGKKPVLYVHDGHCRLEAVKLAISEGAEINELPVVIKDRSCSEEEVLVGMGNSNAQGLVSAALATNALVRHGEQAVAVLQQGLDTAKAQGQSKLTPRHMPEQVRRRAMVKAAPRMVTALHRVVQHPGFKDMPADLRELVAGLLKEVPPEDEGESSSEQERAFQERQIPLDGVVA